ncbi:MAG: acetyl-CoA carboxylase biotin carboxylase subunit [Planctomycetota bacterium]|nr:acetyl-CoA carboxylase biotin carboxylase subunit [Planctomycetota bacterium]
MFQRLLVANRGEVAVRIARACRKLGVAPVGVASEADRGASWTAVMDEVVALGPAPADASYLRLESLVQAALQTRCSAIHPGWGFLAESARFAALCRQHGITFVGPSARILRLMGIKSPAKEAMRRAGLRVVPGSEGPLPNADAAAASADEVGYPVILKADHGGGGRGMRRCGNEAELREAFTAASAEAQAAFGDGSIYLERYVARSRHIEVQILCDHFGAGIHLGERDCSVQRKHQKLIEESPSPVLTDAERAELGASAVRAALALGYTNAGTIEFLRDGDGRLCFMEMNTRLQVEHPVSELTTGVDIVAEQIHIAANRPLSLDQDAIAPRGHAIECRINAEDPAADFRPSPGRVDAFAIPDDAGPGTVRIDTHLNEGDSIPPYYDSLIAKVIAHAESRELGIETMLAALRGARVEGVATTIPLHLAVLESEAFRSGAYDTSAIPGWPP